MDRNEHLLIKLAEECNEVGKAVHKALLFGINDGYPGTDRTNKEDICHELNHLFAAIEMLYPVLEWKINRDTVNEKKKKVEEWIRYSKQKNITTETIGSSKPEPTVATDNKSLSEIRYHNCDFCQHLAYCICDD